MTANEVTPDPLRSTSSIGTSLLRRDGVEKVTGDATYAVEHPVTGPAGEPPLHAWLVTSTVARGRVVAVDPSEALAHPGVVSVIDHTSAPRLADTSDRELAILQDDAIDFRGQIVAVVLAETSEAAREGATLVAVEQEATEHRSAFDEDVETYAPESVNGGSETDTLDGEPDEALARALVTVDATYSTPHEHNNPMEPHAATALWDGERLTLHDSTQGPRPVRGTIGPLLGLEEEQVRVLAPYVGGGFGSKGLPHAPEAAVAMAAMTVPGRPVRLAVTRQQMFALTGYRTPTRSRVRFGAHPDGRLEALRHDTVSQSARVKEFAEQAAVPARVMYAAPHRATTHRLAELDVPVPSWMRAPGEMPGMFAHEVAMDELALHTGVDPVDLRVRNEPEVDPDTGNPWGNRRLVECLRRGAERFGWADRPVEPRATVDGEWWVGTGVAASTYPMLWMPGNVARVRSLEGGRYGVAIAATDIGTGARTVLTQIAADALGCPAEAIEMDMADSDLPFGSVAGGSSGTTSWGTAIVAAAQQFRADHGDSPDPGVETTAASGQYADMDGHALHSFGAVFCEARVHRYTGEVRVPRMLGVYSVGRVVNPRTARSQLLGGLVMGLSAALHEEGWRDPRTGHTVTQDLATYHVAAHADVQQLDAEWLDDVDEISTPMGSRGIGEIGIVGTAAAVANATWHATGVRVRGLPLTADHFLD
ncbi:xanthine dehydrogenase family protein molybdopterin-binding subunit [Nocardioides abyssi]|uniref:Xanthine dehydrogenase family protein molybdopterin-binding subunit n=1 Tax=Nocardioides abyssi TaxID=3058370 RepID=A0ABT8EW74_9ACTN|nr:xanthine dehydrogenase family protein molybdopterin-binding subunit [Nocardioides abyssi]MDN4162303.1 xanthine dehydrogenase family protein molybdopterin-binding subunit [Nocardioides abyssi]